MSTTVEMVNFKLVEKYSESDFLRANKTVEAWVKQQPGFISRHLCLGGDGIWTDIVVWATSASAKAAADQFVQVLADSDFMRAIDFQTAQMAHKLVRASC